MNSTESSSTVSTAVPASSSAREPRATLSCESECIAPVDPLPVPSGPEPDGIIHPRTVTRDREVLHALRCSRPIGIPIEPTEIEVIQSPLIQLVVDLSPCFAIGQHARLLDELGASHSVEPC